MKASNADNYGLLDATNASKYFLIDQLVKVLSSNWLIIFLEAFVASSRSSFIYNEFFLRKYFLEDNDKTLIRILEY